MPPELAPLPADWQRALAVVAHPDDLEYGASGAVASWTTSGKEVSYLLVTRGEAGIAGMAPREAVEVREAEQRRAAELVGVSSVEFLDHRDGVIEPTPRLRRDIAREIRRRRPELVVTLNHRDNWGPGTWNTPDHRATGTAVLDAVADAGNEWIFPELVAEGAAPWRGVRWVAVAASPSSSHAVDISESFEQAVRSLAAHRAYLSALSDEPPEQYARRFLDTATRQFADRFGGKRCVPFELFEL
ncbi:PIG-L deacetylase family protein [Saccharopolyspora rectivirgula]|uniref:GlcNAc-PI de-N-acetylase n=1 Tax=Saccharopolyspora rectivirgula TaxID=28042 RepID=A0A073AXH4_9PSEU|nr:PIG-L deacetylase family protein [Saccharopolyspora rectivirgula]KEI44095.1 GlcNAc-PI de-N-acetylase [Saccharopolyspora rectivirgula]